MAKIVTIPNNKRILPLNEAFFDDDGYTNDEVADNEGPVLGQELFAKIDKDMYGPKIEAWLEQLAIFDYTIIYSGDGIFVDVNNHLILSNRRLTSIPYFRFRYVKGDCNFSSNKFTDWRYFPLYINGDLIANFNYIRDFKDAPDVKGKIYADRQRIRPLYKLSEENYKKVKAGETVLENTVYIPSTNKFGIIKNINENMCTVLHDDNTTAIYATHEVEVLNGADYLDLI